LKIYYNFNFGETINHSFQNVWFLKWFYPVAFTFSVFKVSNLKKKSITLKIVVSTHNSFLLVGTRIVKSQEKSSRRKFQNLKIGSRHYKAPLIVTKRNLRQEPIVLRSVTIWCRLSLELALQLSQSNRSIGISFAAGTSWYFAWSKNLVCLVTIFLGSFFLVYFVIFLVNGWEVTFISTVLEIATSLDGCCFG